MPVLQLRIAPAPDAGTRAELARVLTQLAHTHLGKRREVTAVLVEGFEADAWYIDGVAAQTPTALLEIDVTQGTNTDAQKAAFVQAAHAALRERLGNSAGFAQASYVVVRELPAGNWGYDGRTQRDRQRGAEAKAP